MTLDISKLRTSSDLKRDGVWIQYMGDTYFKVRHMNSEAYMALTKSERDAQRYKDDIERRNRAFMDIIWKYIIVDWCGIDDSKDGVTKPFEFNEKNFKLLAEDMPEVILFITESAAKLDNFRKDNEERSKEVEERLKKQ